MDAVSSTGSVAPYVGTATLFVWPPNQDSPDQYVISCDVNGHWEHMVYASTPGEWRYLARIGFTVHAATPDLLFLVSETAFPPPS
jgi:hypothetical protein